MEVVLAANVSPPRTLLSVLCAEDRREKILVHRQRCGADPSPCSSAV